MSFWEDVKNFTYNELACRCCAKLPDTDFINGSILSLQEARELLDEPMVINCGHRCFAHNVRVGGAPLSMHKDIAFDISIVNRDNVYKQKLLESLIKAGFGSFGFYPTFLHVDMRQGARWCSKGAGTTWNKVALAKSLMGNRKWK